MDKFIAEVDKYIQEYGVKVTEAMEMRINKAADDVLEYIKTNAPRSTSVSNHLADSFIKTKIGNTIYVSSKTKGSLVHLLEFGFRHTNGKFIKGRPFLIPSYEKIAPQMLDDLKRIIQNGS